MKWAKTKENELVHANDARRSARYRCPLCQAPVTLRRGDQRADHFAHRQGYGRPECEYFHPSQYDQGSRSQPQASKPEPIASPYTSIQCRAKGEQLEWALLYHLPPPPSARGKLRINIGGMNSVEVDLRDSIPRWRQFRLHVGTYAYGVSWVSPEVDDRYAKIVQERILGPSQIGIAVFQSRTGEMANTFEVEVEYFLLFRESSVNLDELPLEITSSGANEGWACVSAFIPEDADPEAISVLESLTELKVSPSWIAISPLNVEALSSPSFRTLELAENKRLLFAVTKGPSIDPIQAHLAINDGSTTCSEPLPNSQESMFLLDTHLDGGGGGFVLIDQARGFVFELGARRCLAEPANAGLVVAGRFHSIFDIPRLSDVRADLLISDTYISAPPEVKGRIELKLRNDSVEVKEVGVSNCEPCSVMSGNLKVKLDDIREQLRIADVATIALDFGGLGRVTCQIAEQRRAKPPLTTEQLRTLHQIIQVATSSSRDSAHMRAQLKNIASPGFDGIEELQIEADSPASYALRSFKERSK